MFERRIASPAGKHPATNHPFSQKGDVPMAVMLQDADVKEAAAAKDRERLQGVWNFVTGRRKVQLFISGGHFTAKFSNGDVYLGTFDLDPTRKPKAMDMTVNEGPLKFKGVTAKAIYALDGEHLVWCPAEPGATERPKAFPPTDSLEYLCIVFRREK
jgi:uncharacterized protein (TIGR03067 family)